MQITIHDFKNLYLNLVKRKEVLDDTIFGIINHKYRV